MIWELVAFNTERSDDIRYFDYTKSKRKAEAFAKIPKIQFTDSGHGVVFVAREVKSRTKMPFKRQGSCYEHVDKNLKLELKRYDDHVRYEPLSGRANCYHCGDSYQVTPCSLNMAPKILTQFIREHRRCELSEEGTKLRGKVTAYVADTLAKHPSFAGGLARLSIGDDASLGAKIAFSLEMDMLKEQGIVE